MPEILEWVGYILGAVGGVTILAGTTLFIMWWTAPKNVEIMISQIARVFSFFGTRVRRVQIKFSLQGRLNKEISQLEEETQGATPHGISIEWVPENSKRESFLRGNRVVCRMSYQDNPHLNFINAAMLYVNSGLMPTARRYLSAKMRLATDLTVVGLILSRAGNRGAERVFYEDMLPNQLIEHDCERLYEGLIHQETHGLFSRIFLPEVIDYGWKLHGIAPQSRNRQELERFAQYLESVAQAADDRTPTNLEFNDEVINIGIVYVGIREKLTLRGADPYLQAIRIHGERGAVTVYLAARGNSRSALQRICELAVTNNLCTMLDRRDFSTLVRNRDGTRTNMRATIARMGIRSGSAIA